MARRFVEDRHEAVLAKQVVDVRPWTSIYGEWLGVKINAMVVTLPQLFIAALVPMLAVPLLISVLMHLAAHLTNQPVLPLRYPVGSVDNKGKPGEGILLFGSIDSDSEYERFKQVWMSDDDLRKHLLILGSTGSGKSETLKGLFFNALCWSSGYFVADGKADNKLPTDSHQMTRSMGRDDDCLTLNFLLGGKTPEQVRRSRRRRTNGMNPVSSSDADTIIQMGANLLPKVEGEGKNWQEKALNLWRAVIQALCYRRDTEGMDLSMSTIIEYLALPKVEELYLMGYVESLEKGEWSSGFAGVKSYLDTGCPSYKVEKLLAKNGHGSEPPPPARPGTPPGKAFEQDSMAYEQHSYRTTQLMPVLNLLDKTYGFIFRDKYPEIDMIDVTLNNRILVMLIPSLEKSSQEAENLGKLAIACLRVMMGKNLGAEIEGTRDELINSKATAAPYPYLVALDELAYYFSDGIAVMFAQARSLGFNMIAAAQDLEKLTEGNRAAEAGAMLANTVLKFFMRGDDPNKTYEFVSKVLGKIRVAMRQSFELGSFGYKKSKDIVIQEVERVTLKEMQEKGVGEGIVNTQGKSLRVKSFYLGDYLKEHRTTDFWVLRFLQVEPPSDAEVDAFSIPMEEIDNPIQRGQQLLATLRHQRARTGLVPPRDPVLDAVAMAAQSMNAHTRASQRAAVLFEAARKSLEQEEGVVRGGAQAEGADTQEAAARQGGRPAVNTLLTPSRALSGSHGAGPAVAALEGDLESGDDGTDPLSFLLSTPFARKPAEVLLQQSGAAQHQAEVGPESSNPAENDLDLVLRVIRGGRSLNITSAELSDGAEAEAVSLRALTGLTKPGDGMDDAAWVAEAVDEAQRELSVIAPDGGSVVGFAPKTVDQVERIESLLGSPQPKASAAKLETVVAAKVTPAGPRGQLDHEDINAFFDLLDSQ